ncbi:S26 family signal peptidase [Plantactinospora sp. B5E13]|uniref:S26 family signal peptidase n=1 Tax=unclassified Plantactinospora TaxID=2631981 RepID=UPI00325C9299
MADRAVFLLAVVIGAAVVAAIVVGGVVAARRQFMIIKVVGDSMRPGLAPGDRLLVRRTRRLRVGNIVIAHHQEGGRRTVPTGSAASAWLVKRLAALPGDTVPEPVVHAVGGRFRHVPAGMTVLLGEHPESLDSRRWGFVPLEDIEGVAVWRLGPDDR